MREETKGVPARTSDDHQDLRTEFISSDSNRGVV